MIFSKIPALPHTPGHGTGWRESQSRQQCYCLSLEADVTVPVCSQGQAWRKEGKKRCRVEWEKTQGNSAVKDLPHSSRVGASQITDFVCMPKTYLTNWIRKHLISMFHKLVIIRAIFKPASGQKVSPYSKRISRKMIYINSIRILQSL